jgi:hypothetical protein
MVDESQWRHPEPRRVSSLPCRRDNGRCLAAAGWTVPDNYLALRFTDGRVYAYRLTPADVPAGAISEPAVAGCWFNKAVRWNGAVAYQPLGVGEVDGVNWLWG